MSDSELSEASTTPAPPDAELERTLRREVIKAARAGEEYTLRSIRAAAEKKLGLSEGWFKAHADWNAKSKGVVHDQIDTEVEIPTSPVASQRIESVKRQTKPSKSTSPLPAKRASQGRGGPSKKKLKIETEAPEVSSEALSSPPSDLSSTSEAESEGPRKTSKKTSNPKPKPAVKKKEKSAKPKHKAAPTEDESDADDTKDKTDDGTDSDMSVLLDDEPQPKKKGKGKDPHETKSKTSKSTKPKVTTDEDPDQAEIKRLQGWLVKCGIRKVWGKELKPFETPKAKIKHLREMLSDAGMTGRYSIEKANQIKEARELAADIEAVKEGAERWGTGGDGDADNDDGDGGRPARRLVRGSMNYDFLSSDGEETD